MSKRVQPPSDHRVQLTVRGVVNLVGYLRVTPAEGQRLLSRGGEPSVSDGEFRDEWLLASTSLSPELLETLTDPARHRIALAMLRAHGLWGQWRGMYGSSTPISRRLRMLILAELRRQVQPLAARPVGLRRPLAGSQAAAALVSLQTATERFARPGREALRSIAQTQRLAGRAVDQLARPAPATLRALDLGTGRLSEVLRPAFVSVSTAISRASEWLQNIMAQLRGAMDRLIAQPALRSTLRYLSIRQERLAVDTLRPVEMLLRAQRERLRAFAQPPAIVERPAEQSDVLEVPDVEVLAVFYEQERGDPQWQTGPIGWVLRSVPLPIGAALHDRFRASTEAGLGYLAERFARRELRRRLLNAVALLPCTIGVREQLEDGIGHFFTGRWGSADGLLTVGLEGLLFDLAVAEEVLTPSHRIVRPGKKPGNKITTASDGRLLHGIGFDQSQQAFLTSLSLGKAGNPVRHGGGSKFGSRSHAAAALLGVIMVLLHLGRGGPRLIRGLLNA